MELLRREPKIVRALPTLSGTSPDKPRYSHDASALAYGLRILKLVLQVEG